MTQRTKTTQQLTELVHTFELQQDAGQFDFWVYEDILALLSYYDESLNFTQALHVATLATERFPYQYDLYLYRSKYLALNTQIDEALEVLDVAQIHAPGQPEIRIFRSELLLSIGRFSEALQCLNELENQMFGEDYTYLLLSKTKIQEAMKDFDLMFDTLKLVLELDPDNHQALEEIWTSVEQSRRYKESIDLHLQLIDKNPYSYLAWFNLGQAYSCIGDYPKAIEALEYAFIINPDFEAAYMDCAELCFQERQYKRAFSIYEEIHDKFGPEAENLVYMVECLMPLKKYNRARKLLLLALTLDPYNDEVHYYLGECLAAKGQWKEATKAYNKAIKIDERREEYHLAIARAYGKLAKQELALHYYKKATHYAPEQNEYWTEYAQFVKDNIGIEAALDILSAADEHAVGSDLLFEKAVCLYELGLKSKAIEVLEEAILDDPYTTESKISLKATFQNDAEVSALVRYYIKEEL